MFNIGVAGNERVNGFMLGPAGSGDYQGQRKRKGRLAPGIRIPNVVISNGLPSTTNGAAEPLRSSFCNGQLKYSDRLKGTFTNGSDVDVNGLGETSKDMEDPYTFSEPEPVSHYSNPSTTFKTLSKMSSRGMKSKVDKSSNNSCVEPTGLNMTRLYPAISASLGHSFFDSNSTHPSNSLKTNERSRNSLASLLDNAVSDELTPKKGDGERSFSSFSVKELNCFPNLTSPPPPDKSPPTIVSSKVSPVKHGMPSTPQRESNKLAALFSPTYLNSIRNDKAKLSKVSLARTLPREKSSPRSSQSDKRSPAAKEGILKSSVSSVIDGPVKRHDDVSKTTVSRLQDKIARNKVMNKHSQKMDSKDDTDVVSGRRMDMPARRSLLEEQLLGSKPAKVTRKEEGVTSSSLTPPPTATTRVPGMVGPLTYGIARSSTPSSRPAANSSRNQKSTPPSGNHKPSKIQPSSSVSRQLSATYGPVKNNAAIRQTTSRSSPASTHSQGKIDSNRPLKRARTKLDIVAEFLQPETMQRLQASKKADRDVFCKTMVVETDSDDSDLEEGLIYQKHWFSGWREAGSGLAGEERREGRLSQLRAELRRKLGQVWCSSRDPGSSTLPKCVISAALNRPSQTAVVLAPKQRWQHIGRSKLSMLVKKQCVFGKKGEGNVCQSPALPCAHHCVRHITYNVDQQLFEHCTAKFSDNTQCCVPVFDSCHELPLCTEHARKLDNYNRMCQTTKPKRVRKKPKPSAMTRSSKRSKKKKLKPLDSPTPLSHSQIFTTAQSLPACQPRIQRSQSLPVESLLRQDSIECNGVVVDCEKPSLQRNEVYVTDDSFVRLHSSEPQQINEKVEHVEGHVEGPIENHINNHHIDGHHINDVDGVDVVEEEVLAMAAELPLDTVDLAQQASGLLEEHDLTNVLNQIPADAFNDLFIEDKNGEPTREETEELERALAAVDKDVKSLERMGSQIMLDYKAQELLHTPSSQSQVFLEVDKLSQSHGLLDIDKLQAQGLFDEKNAQGLLNLLDDQTLVQTLTAELPTELPGTSSSLVYYHNGYALTTTSTEKNVSMTPNNSSSLYQHAGMANVPLPTQTDLH